MNVTSITIAWRDHIVTSRFDGHGWSHDSDKAASDDEWEDFEQELQDTAVGRFMAEMASGAATRDLMPDVHGERPGRVYDCDLYIEGSADVGWCLTIGNSSRTGALADLETELHRFAVGEGYLDTTLEQFAGTGLDVPDLHAAPAIAAQLG